MIDKYLAPVAFLGVFLVLFSLPVAAGVLNTGFLDSQANQDADLTMEAVPRNMLATADTLFLSWTPRALGNLRYSTSFRGPEPQSYPNVVANPVVRTGGQLAIRCTDIPVGLIYCIVDGGDQGYSAVFRVIRMASVVPRMSYPITGEGREGINTVTPNFQWQPVQGVPYYHVIVSDQPFDITEDEEGAITVEGANLIWQAITANTEIMYGYPDPSGYFEAENIPPLVGSRDRENRPVYNWLVLNNYGNHPAYTSTVTGGISAFEVEIDPPFGSPELISPENGAHIMDNEVLLRWTQIPQANSYFVYVAREEITPGGSQGFIPAWNEQTTLTSISCPARDVLATGRFVWKVLAANRQGYGTVSDTGSFRLSLETGHVTFRSYTAGNRVLENVELTVETIEGMAFRPFGTDDNGLHERDIPVGRYRFIGNKTGFLEQVSDIITVQADQRYTVNLTLQPRPASIIGTVVNAQNRPVSGATVVAADLRNNLRQQTETDIGGEYQIDVSAGAWVISATAPGHSPSRQVSIQVDNGDNYDFDDHQGPLVVSLYEYNITGTVSNPQGQGIHLADVIIENANGQRMVTHTPEGGVYTFLVGVGDWIMNARKPGFYLESGNVPIRIVNRDVVQNFVLIPQAGILSGQVYLGDNLANRNADVWFIPDAGQVTIMRVNQLGAFAQGVSPGSYRMVPVLSGYSARDTLDIDVGPGETLSGLTLRMRANPSSIAGQVIDAANRPIAEATVTAGGVQTTSAQDGSYRLNVSEGTHTVRASRQNYITAEVGPIQIQVGQNLGGVNLRLIDNAGSITGRIYRGNDPIYDAVITATSQDNNQAFTTRSDQQGNYNFGLRHGTYRLTAQRSGFVSAAPGYIDVQLQPGQQVSNRNFAMLNYSARISGNVTSAAGAVNTPSVCMIPLNDPNVEYATNGNVEGRFSLTVTPERRYIVITTKEGFSTARDTTAALNIEGEAVVNQRLTALPCRIQGQVLVNNQALARATIRADGNQGRYEVITGDGGIYQLNLESGQYNLTVSKPGYTQAESQIRLNPGEQRQGINFALQENFALISGAVLDPDRNQIANATVTLTEISSNRQAMITTGQDGIFEFSRLVPGNYRLNASHAQYAATALNIGEVVGGQVRRQLNLTMQPLNARITGIVRSGQNPVAEATVYAQFGEEEITTTSNQAGEFVFPNVEAATYDFLPTKAGYTGVELENQEVEPGDTVAVVLQLVRNDGRITGFVRDPDNVGLRGARVSASDNLGNFAAATTSANGAFTVENLYPNSRYSLSVQLANYAADEDTLFNVSPGETRNFTLRPNQLQISGRVQNQVARALGGTEISVTSLSDGSLFRNMADGSGNFTFNGLARNTRYRLQTYRQEEQYVNADQVLQTVENHMQGINLIVTEFSSSISGSCSGVRQVSITATNVVTGRVINSNTDADGRYQLLRLRDGNLSVRAEKVGYRVTPEAIAVNGLGVNDHRADVNFEVQRITVTIAGRVEDSAGQPMPLCPVLAWSGAGQARDTTDQNGEFEFNGIIPNQRYSLATELPLESYDNGSVDIDVQSSNVSGAVLRIVRHNASLIGFVRNALTDVNLSSALIRVNGVVRDTSLADGAYLITHLSGGEHAVHIDKSGYIPFDGVVNTGNGEGEYQQNFHLTPLNQAIYGQVYNVAMTEPLVNCIVTLTDDLNQVLVDTTDDNGRYFFNRLALERTYTRVVSKKGFESKMRSSMQVGVQQDYGTMVLDPVKSAVSGSFELTTGEPIVGAPVMLKSFENDVLWDTTDFSGDFCIPADNGRYMLLAIHPTPGMGTSFTRNVVLSGQDPVQLSLSLLTTSVIKGVLVTDDGETPATMGYIACRHEATGVFVTDVAADHRAFLLRGLRPGAQNLQVEVPGYAMVLNPFIVEAILGDTSEVTIVVTKSGKAITGYVRDETDQGVARARVDLIGPVSGQFVTAADGYFSLAEPDTGLYTIHVERVGYTMPADTAFEVHAGEFIDIIRTVTLIPNAISGRIQNDFAANMPDVMVVRSGVGAPDTVFTDDYGDYFFPDLAPGIYSVRPVREFYTVTPTSRNISLEAGSAALNADFKMQLNRGQGNVAGAVFLENQRAAGIAVIMTDQDTYEQHRAVTDSLGEYHFNLVPAPATYRIRSSKDNVVDVALEPFRLLANTSETRDITFPTGKISTRLTDAAGNPIFNRAVRIAGDKLNWNQPFYTDQLGVAESFGFLPAGIYTVTPSTTEGEFTPRPRVITLGENEQIALNWSLGWNLTPPLPPSTEDSSRVEIRIPAAVNVSPNRFLYWLEPGSAEWSNRPLQREAGILAVSERRDVRSVGSKYHAPDRDEPGGLYFAYIPPQTRSGTLSYYLEVHTVDGFVFGGPSTAQELQITNRRMLDHVAMIRSLSGAEPRIGVPLQLRVEAFNDQRTEITELLGSSAIQWSQLDESRGELTVDPDDPFKAVYCPLSVGPVRIRATVTQTESNVVVRHDESWTNENLTLARIDFSLTPTRIANTDSTYFTVTAKDSSGRATFILPIWETDNPQLGQFISEPYSINTKYRATPKMVGTTQIMVTDSLTGLSAVFNNLAANRSLRGLMVLGVITRDSSQTDTLVLSNGLGVNIAIPSTSIDVGTTGFVSLRRPTLSSVVKVTKDFECPELGYFLEVTGDVKLNTDYYLTIPTPDEFQGFPPLVGVWNETDVAWEAHPGDYNADSSLVTARFDNLGGLYSFLVASQPLSIEGLKFSPNPFSPDNRLGGVSIEFVLNSDLADRLPVDLKIYNMSGELIRTLFDGEMLEKGKYYRDAATSERIVVWDGLTDSGRMARNGRYIAVLIAKDPSGEVKQVGTLVMVK